MADDSKDNVVKQAENFERAHEETSKTLSGLADEYIKGLFHEAKIGKEAKSGKDDPYSYSGDGKTSDRKGEKKPGQDPGRDPYDYSGDGRTSDKGDSKSAASALHTLFDRAKSPAAGADKVESFEGGKGELRVLPTGDGGITGQYVDAQGKTTTRVSENASVEYDPRTQKYTSVDKSGKRSELKDDDHVDPADKSSETLKELKERGVAQEQVDAAGSMRTTYPDGRMTTVFKGNDRLAERTTFPPGYRSDNPNDKGENAGLRQIEKFRELPEKDQSPRDNATACSARTVRTFEDRKETTFEKGDIAGITAFKNSDRDHPAVITNYRDNKGPGGASSVETYRADSRPDGVKQICKFHDGNDREIRPDKLVFNNGITADRPINGDIRRGVGEGNRTGVLDISKDNGMPTHMQIGDNDYKVTYGPDGKIAGMTVEGKGNPPSHLKLERDPATSQLKVTVSDGTFAPKDGKINLDGLPLGVDKDGKIDGEVHLNKAGDLRFITGGGPERHEIVRRANGSTEDYDFKNWTKTTTGADGQVKPVERWDGYRWRSDGKASADGKHVDFPDGTSTDRRTSGNPPQDVTIFGSKNGSPQAYDWLNGKRMELDKDGKEVEGKTTYYDGTGYRPGVEQKLQNGDTAVTFKEPVKPDEATMVVHHQDGATTNMFADQSKVEKDARGHVTEVAGPAGAWKFERDGDGDISRAREYGADGHLKNVYTRQGQEKDPGMEQWLEHEGNGTPRQPSDRPPRDPNAAGDYNSWKTLTPLNRNTAIEYDPASKAYTRVGKDGQRTALTDDNARLDPEDPNSKTLADFKKERAASPSADGMNIHTTANGTVRIESTAPDGKPAEMKLRPPTGDVYRETATQKLIDRPGNVTEIIDKKNPALSSLEFTRNGKLFQLSSKDGPYRVWDNGVVSQESPASADNPNYKASVGYLPDGSIANLVNDNGTEKVVALQIAANDPAKPGAYETLKAGTPPCKSLERNFNCFQAVVTDDKGQEIKTVFDPSRRTREQQLPGEQFTRVSELGSGKPLGVNDLQRQPLLRLNPDHRFAIGPDGARQYGADKWDLDPTHMKIGPNGEPVILGKNGVDKAVFKADGTVVETVDGKEKSIFPNKTEASFENGKLNSISIQGKEYSPVFNGDGSIASLKPKGGGEELKPIPAGTAYKLAANGVFSFDSTDAATGITNHQAWLPEKNQAYFSRLWQSADGKSTTGAEWLVDKDGQVQKLQLPGTAVVDVSAKKAENPKFDAKYEGGKLKLTLPDDMFLVLNEDGSTDLTRNGAIEHRDRFGNLVPKK